MHLRYAVVGILLTVALVGIFGCTSTETANVPPTADFSLSPSTGNAPLTVSFDATNSSDPDGDITNFSWDFGDGATGTGKTIAHKYEKPGTYNTELVVTDNVSATSSITRTVGVVNSAPTAIFTTNTRETPGEVAFDASGSSDVDGKIVSYHWILGDQTTATERTLIHTYLETGDYVVDLTVTDNNGATDNKVEIITIAKSTAEIPGQQGPLEVLGWKLQPSNNPAVAWVVTGHARNISDQVLDYAEVQAHFFDSNNATIDSWFDNTADLQPGDVWKFNIFLLSSQNIEDVDHTTSSLGPWW